MKKLIATVFIALVPMVGFAHGDPNYKPIVDKVEAIKIARMVIDQQVSVGKIAASWKNAEHIGTRKNDKGLTWAWVNTFKNSKKKDATKQTLDIVLTQSGFFVATNFR